MTDLSQMSQTMMIAKTKKKVPIKMKKVPRQNQGVAVTMHEVDAGEVDASKAKQLEVGVDAVVGEVQRRMLLVHVKAG